MRARVWGALTVAVLAAGSLGACGTPAPVEAGTGYVAGDGTVTTWPAASRPGPVTLAGKGTDGAELTTQAMMGDVVVVNFWQSACPPCRAEAADLAALQREFAPGGVRFLGVNSADDAATARAFERTHQAGYPTILDTTSQVTAALQGVVALQAVPVTIVLDREGKVAGRILGRIETATLRGLISGALGATP